MWGSVMDDLVYYTGEAVLTEYIKNLNAEFPQSKHTLQHCPSCGETSVHIVFPSLTNTKAGMVHEHWVSSVYPHKKTLYPYMSCFFVDQAWIEHRLDYYERELASWPGAEPSEATAEQQACTCDWARVLSEGCQCGGI
jgi:hypothetical protein